MKMNDFMRLSLLTELFNQTKAEKSADSNWQWYIVVHISKNYLK